MSEENQLGTAADLMAERTLNTRWGAWRELAFRFGKHEVVALTLGSWGHQDQVLVRLHSTCFSAHYLESTECDCREQLELAYGKVVARGSGAIVFLEQDGRDNGHVALMRAAVYAKAHQVTQTDAYTELGYPADPRSFESAAAVLVHLNVQRALLMTNNPRKIAALRAAGIEIEFESLMSAVDNDVARKFYRDKALEGYLIDPENM